MIQAKRFSAEGPDEAENEEQGRRWAVMLRKSEGERPSQADLQHWGGGGKEAERVLEEIEEAFQEEDGQAYPEVDGLVDLVETAVDQAGDAGYSHCTQASVGFGMDELPEPHILEGHSGADPYPVEGQASRRPQAKDY
jgi:hypothetical protein